MKEIKVVRLCGTLEKAMGLLGREKGKCVYFETRWGVHTFGMKYPIDVLILDNENRVVKMALGLRPNRIFVWSPIYYKVVELPAGYILNEEVGLEQVLKLNIE